MQADNENNAVVAEDAQNERTPEPAEQHSAPAHVPPPDLGDRERLAKEKA